MYKGPHPRSGWVAVVVGQNDELPSIPATDTRRSDEAADLAPQGLSFLLSEREIIVPPLSSESL